LGANAGFTSVYFARVYPSASLAYVEPVPDNVRILTWNLELNEIEPVVFPGAADAGDGCVVMELGVMDYGHKIASPPIESKLRVEVAGFSVPTILRRLGWDRVGLLKIDIEGHERALFAGDCEWLKQVDNMCIECHEGFGARDLQMLAERFNFCMPRALPGIWFMNREASIE
jgi:FkbM family methyltransferase